jgi:hypothetical protein
MCTKTETSFKKMRFVKELEKKNGVTSYADSNKRIIACK